MELALLAPAKTQTRPFYLAATALLAAAGAVAGMTFLFRPPWPDAKAQCLIAKLNMVNAKWDVSETAGDTLSIKVSTQARGEEIGRKVAVLPYFPNSNEPPMPGAKYISLILTERRESELTYNVTIIMDGAGHIVMDNEGVPKVRRGYQTNSRIVNPGAGLSNLLDAAAACDMLGKLDVKTAKATLAELIPK